MSELIFLNKEVVKVDNRMWALFVNLSFNMWLPKNDGIVFDDDFWSYIVEKAAKSGVNTIILDVGDGVKFDSHPEISLHDAWDRERVSREIKRLKTLGIKLIPKLNFSTGHCYWLGEYNRMISSKLYYEMCRDVISELYDIFEAPDYIHIGMDEEVIEFASLSEYVVFRQGDLLMHDIKFLIDCVRNTGAKAMMWADGFFDHTDIFTKYIKPEDAILFPWYYLSFKKENYTPVDILPDADEQRKRGINYIEELPVKVNFRNKLPKLIQMGYDVFPCGSNWWHSDTNMEELVEYFENNATNEMQIKGYMTAPWKKTLPEYKIDFDESLDLLKKVKSKFDK